jgi:hypothetical protein
MQNVYDVTRNELSCSEDYIVLQLHRKAHGAAGRKIEYRAMAKSCQNYTPPPRVRGKTQFSPVALRKATSEWLKGIEIAVRSTYLRVPKYEVETLTFLPGLASLLATPIVVVVSVQSIGLISSSLRLVESTLHEALILSNGLVDSIAQTKYWFVRALAQLRFRLGQPFGKGIIIRDWVWRWYPTMPWSHLDYSMMG